MCVRTAWAGLAALGVLGGLLVTAPAAVASPSVTPDLTDGVNGEVYASVQVGDRTFIGGTFSWAGPFTASAVPVDTTTGKRLPVPKVRGLVRAAVPDGAGGWYVGGDFVFAGGKVRNGAARIRVLRASSRPGTPHPQARCTRWPCANGVVYLGGSFSQMGGQSRSNIAAVDATSGAVARLEPRRKRHRLVAGHERGSVRRRVYAGGARSATSEVSSGRTWAP